MVSFDPSQAFRYQTDAMLAQPSILGVAPYICNLVTKTGAQRSVGQTSGLGTITTTRLLVGAMFDGYFSFAPNDGYLNPLVRDVNGEVAILSAQTLTEMEWMLGPLVFPYQATDIYGNAITGGTDANLFFPSTPEINVYIQLLGPGLNPTYGAYFKVQEVVLSKAFNVSYKLRMIALGGEIL